MDFDALSRFWYQDGISSESFILGGVYFDEDSQSNVVGASGELHSAASEQLSGQAAMLREMVGRFRIRA